MRIEFNRLPISEEYGQSLFDIYYVTEEGRSEMMELFISLPQNVKDLVKDLISRMATVKNFKSPKIKYNLKSYNFGEIRPLPHRFFFFQKCGSNYVFFDYILKKKDSVDDKIYKKIDEKKHLYEEEFEKYKSTS